MSSAAHSHQALEATETKAELMAEIDAAQADLEAAARQRHLCARRLLGSPKGDQKVRLSAYLEATKMLLRAEIDLARLMRQL